MSATPANQRITALDGLRGIAILAVLAWHYFACVSRPELGAIGRVAEKIAAFGWTGVPLFFVLSGFLIGRILIRHRGAGRYFQVFYLRRACRILPLYFALLLLVGFLVPRNHGIQGPWIEPHSDSVPIWSYAVFIQNIFMARAESFGSSWLAVTWSLAIEEQFYLLLPLIVWFVHSRRLPSVLVGGIVACWFYRWLAVVQETHVYVNMLMLPGRMDGLFIGALMAWAWENAATSRMLCRHSRPILLIGILAGIVVVGFELQMLPRSVRMLYLIGGFSLLSVCFASIMNAALSVERGLIARVLSLRVLGFCGGISYFAYLFHQPVNYLVHGFLRDDAPSISDATGVVASCLALAIVVTSGTISLRFFEEPILRWGRNFAYSGGRKQRLALVDTVSDSSPVPANLHHR